MYITTNVEDIIKSIADNPDLTNLVAKTNEMPVLVIQKLVRDDIEYLALRNIEVYYKYQRKGILKRIVSAMEQTNRNILIDHILNPILFNYFHTVGYEPFSYIIDGVISHCMRKMSGNLIES